MSRSGVSVNLDRSAIDELLAGAPAMSAVEVAAWAVVAALRESSPKKSGRLSKSWTARSGRDDSGGAVAWVSTRVPYWHILQYGSVERPALRYIDKGLSRTGLPYTPSPKEA